MAVAITVLNQKHLPGLGLITHGTFDLSGSYATGGDTPDLEAELKGRNDIEMVHCGFSGDYTAFYNPDNGKLRIFKIASGVMTERANASAYDENISIPFTAYSK